MRDQLLEKYLKFLDSLLDHITYVYNVEDEVDVKSFNRITRISTNTIRKCNNYLKQENLSDKDREQWTTLKIKCFNIIYDLSDLMPSVLSELAIGTNPILGLAAFESCSDVVSILYSEELEKEGKEKPQENILSPEQLEAIRLSFV